MKSENPYRQPLIEQISSYENLLWGYHQAAKKCKKSIDRCDFVYNMPAEIHAMKYAIEAGVYQWGPYTEKIVVDPKIRMIHKAPFRDRVVHQAIFKVIDPILERHMIHHTYACRIGKGTGLAVRDVQRVIGNFCYALKLDVSKYFRSVSHERLKEKLRIVFYEPRLVALLENLVDSFHPGIPIGNLTSQLFANWYLNDIDHFVKRELRVRHYFRYMDDLLLLGNNKETLWRCAKKLQERAMAQDYLYFSNSKTMLFKTECGVPFLGYRLYKNGKPRILGRGLQRFKDRLKKLKRKNRPESEIAERICGWYGHARSGLRKKITKDLGIYFFVEEFE